MLCFLPRKMGERIRNLTLDGWFNHQGFRKKPMRIGSTTNPDASLGSHCWLSWFFRYPTSTWWYGEFPWISGFALKGFWYHDIIYYSSYFVRMTILNLLFGIMWLFRLNIDSWTTLVSKNWSMETIRCGQNYQNHHVVWSDEVSNPSGPSSISFSHTKTKDRRQSGFNRSPRAFQDFPPISFTSKTG